jgi:SAM-dependent methyltransferase
MNYRKFKIVIDFVFPTCRKLLVEASLRRFDFSCSEDVLIIGAGSDPYRHMFSPSCRYITMDIAPINGITQVIADAHSLPVKNTAFDCILASEVFEHLFNPIAFVNAAFDALKPGGKLILTVPFMFHQHADPHDYWRPTRQALIYYCANFSSCDVYAQGNRLHVISDLFTTAFYPWPIFYPFRILNHLFCLFNKVSGKSTAPTGFLVVVTK